MSTANNISANTPYDNLFTIFNERKSHRDFSPLPVPEENIAKILAIAKTSPYASNKKNWEVKVVTDRELIETLAATVQLVAEQQARKIRADLRDSFLAYAASFVFFRRAPLLLIPVFRVGKAFTYMMGDTSGTGHTPGAGQGSEGGECRENHFSPSQWEHENYVKSISCVCMSILLAAQSLGLGSCYMTGPLIAEQELNPQLNIKKGRRIAAIIPVGFPVDNVDDVDDVDDVDNKVSSKALQNE
ncbi:MAG: nitroreductase family protein [bacterium]|nr:nitroreductase family protein [bacterium]